MAMGALIGALVGTAVVNSDLPRLDAFFATPAPKRPILLPALPMDTWPSRSPSDMWKE